MGRFHALVAFVSLTALRVAGGEVSASSAAHGEDASFHTVFASGGVRVSPRNVREWTLELRTTGFGPRGAIRPVDLVQERIVGPRLEYTSSSGLESWFVRREDGLVHGFAVLARPAEGPDGGPLLIEIDLSGNLVAKFSETAQSLDLYDRGSVVLRYSTLLAVDADGVQIPTRLERSGETRLLLVLERASGAFPLVVESLLETARRPGSEETEAGAGFGSPEAAPANDTCAGATPIPGEGPFPYMTPAFDLAEATTAGDPVARPSCAYPLNTVTRSLWFAFTPTETDAYTFATCADLGTGTTVDDPVMAIYTSTGGCAGPFAELSGACDDDGCDQEQFQPSVTATLAAGTTYYVVVWNGGPAPASGNTSLAIRVSRPSVPPLNDTCAGGSVAPYVVPPAGPFPVLTAMVPDITDATASGDPPSPSCLGSGFTASRSVWYTFTPAVSATYRISSCALDQGGTATTVNDTLIAIYGSAGGCAGPFTEVPTAGTSDGCDDDGCSFESFQAVVSTSLTAGTPYFIVSYKVGAAAPAPGNSAVQLRVDRIQTPPNDDCAAAIPVAVDAPVAGSTESAFHDYLVTATSECFSGVGQAVTSAQGPDVVYEFTAPESGAYSFRVTGYAPSNDLVLYVASDCPSGPLPATATCLAGANRNTSQPSEEVPCVSLESQATVWIYVDEARASSGSRFALEVNRCTEEAEPNDTTTQAGALACGLEGSKSPAADVDFFSVGSYPAGARLFALVDGVAANTTDFDLRVTTASDTLEYDDLNADVAFGSLAPTCDGTSLPISPAFLRVSMFGSSQVAEPYRIYSVVQPQIGAAALEIEPNDSIAQATQSAAGYMAGSLSDPSPSSDVDLVPLDAVAGELIFLGLDADPERDGTPLNARLSLLDPGGAVLATVDDGDGTSSIATGAGSLTAVAPRSPGEGLTWRATYTGTYYAKVEAGGAANTPRTGAYLLSISLNCRSSADPDGDGVADADDCAPADPTAFSIPDEITGVSFGSDKATLSWAAPGGGSGTIHDVLRGVVGSLPVGPGGGDETCFEDVPAATWPDASNPPVLAGYWYLVRGVNACGAGTYGNSLVNGSPDTLRSTSTCP